MFYLLIAKAGFLKKWKISTSAPRYSSNSTAPVTAFCHVLWHLTVTTNRALYLRCRFLLTSHSDADLQLKHASSGKPSLIHQVTNHMLKDVSSVVGRKSPFSLGHFNFHIDLPLFPLCTRGSSPVSGLDTWNVSQGVPAGQAQQSRW